MNHAPTKLPLGLCLNNECILLLRQPSTFCCNCPGPCIGILLFYSSDVELQTTARRNHHPLRPLLNRELRPRYSMWTYSDKCWNAHGAFWKGRLWLISSRLRLNLFSAVCMCSDTYSGAPKDKEGIPLEHVHSVRGPEEIIAEASLRRR